MLRRLAVCLGIAAVTLVGAAEVGHANVKPAGKPRVAFAAHGKVEQEAYWAKSANHPDAIVCVTKGDKAEAVYKIAKFAKANRKLGYYWGGLAGKRFDKLCNAPR